MTDEVEVWLDADFLERTRVGTLSHDRNTERADHVLNIDESDNRPSFATVIDTSEWYVGSKDRGRAIVTGILHETRRWRQTAQVLKIARADVELTSTAFSESAVARD